MRGIRLRGGSSVGGSMGYTLVELIFVVAVAATVLSLSVPLFTNTVDHLNTSGAARYVAGRIGLARLDAVRRGSVVGFRFARLEDDYSYQAVIDGNGNGLRSADLTAGVDLLVGTPERLSHHFRDARFGLMPGVPEIDGGTGNADGVRIGSTAFLSMTPIGSATGGTLYIRGERTQFAVRIFGATGRTKVFFYDRKARRWVTR